MEMKQKLNDIEFVFMTTRAMHLAIAGDITTDSFILALLRFIARRENVKDNRSDNGANFKGAQKEFQDAIAEIKIPKVASESVKNMLILSGHLTQQVAHGWEWPGKHL